MTVVDTATSSYAVALLLTLLRARIAELENKLAGAYRTVEELEETAAECRLLHSGARPEVRRASS